MWAMAAPASAASMAASAICGRRDRHVSERPAVSPAPVTAQVMKTSQFTARLSDVVAVRGKLSDRRMRHHPRP